MKLGEDAARDSRMTLATFVLLLCLLASVPGVLPQRAQATDTGAPQIDQGTASQQPAAEGRPTSDSSAQAKSKSSPSTPSKGTAAKKRRNRKRVAGTGPCVTPPTTSTPTNSTAQKEPADPAGAVSPPSVATTPTSKDCPPPKIVVRQGGSKDPSIQLAGGNADHAAQQRDSINQLLGQTDQNLKKAEETQLSDSQQEVVTQTRQYVVQSKAAMANGDFERARTLAWKAQLLSQDLVKLEK